MSPNYLINVLYFHLICLTLNIFCVLFFLLCEWVIWKIWKLKELWGFSRFTYVTCLRNKRCRYVYGKMDRSLSSHSFPLSLSHWYYQFGTCKLTFLIANKVSKSVARLLIQCWTQCFMHKTFRTTPINVEQCKF